MVNLEIFRFPFTSVGAKIMWMTSVIMTSIAKHFLTYSRIAYSPYGLRDAPPAMSETAWHKCSLCLTVSPPTVSTSSYCSVNRGTYYISLYRR